MKLVHCRVLSRTAYQTGVSKNRGVTHRYTRDLLTYLLECCCVYLDNPKFDLYIFSKKIKQKLFVSGLC